jgi:basic membrane protein A and related proteins
MPAHCIYSGGRTLATFKLSRRTLALGAAAATVTPALGLAGRLAPEAAAQDKIVATMVTDTAGLGDQNFNDLAYKGGKEAEEAFGIEFKVIESQDATSYLPNLTAGAEQGALTIGVGFLLTDAIAEVAAQFPDRQFMLIDSVAEVDNVASVLFKEQEAAFLAGVAAALTTKTNKLGVVGGMKIPPVVRYAVGFEAGVNSVNADCQVLVGYADTFDDPALGKELSLAQFEQGADIVFPVAGRTGIGSFEAAKEKGEGYLAIGADADQDHLAPGFQLCYAAKGVDYAVYSTIEQVTTGEFSGGIKNLGLAEGGVALGNPQGKVSEEIMAVVAKYEAAIIEGTVVPPTSEEELASFEPTAPDALPEATPTA